MIPPTLRRYGGWMMWHEFHSSEAAQDYGLYLPLNVFGAPAGMTVTMRPGELFPALPSDFARQALAGHSPYDLLQVAQRFDALADRWDASMRLPKHALSGSFSQVRDYCRLPAVVISSQDLERGNVQTSGDGWRALEARPTGAILGAYAIQQ
jgi:hypothetical protein